jgi:drug/metabolite transporter (DMT)-like permease
MDADNNTPENTEKLKEIPKWTRKYAQNRTLTILVLMVMIGLFAMIVAALFGFLLSLAVTGFRKGNIVLGCVGIAVLIAVSAALAKFYIYIFAKFGGKNKALLDQIIDRRIYGREGIASMLMPEAAKKKKWLEIAVAIVWGTLFLGTMYLGMVNFIPVKYVQPVSALYCVPYMILGWYFWRSPRTGPIFLLKPTLYSIHSILILIGVPIFFTSSFGAVLNMSLPLLGYGYLTLVIGHLYSRYALKKLKGLTHLEGDTANGD